MVKMESSLGSCLQRMPIRWPEMQSSGSGEDRADSKAAGCKIIDYGKYKYEMIRREKKEAKKKQKVIM